jgi:hypothetical protein
MNPAKLHEKKAPKKGREKETRATSTSHMKHINQRKVSKAPHLFSKGRSINKVCTFYETAFNFVKEVIFGPHNKQNGRQRKAKNKLIAKRGTMYREIKLHKMAMKEITPHMKGMEYFCMSRTLWHGVYTSVGVVL